MRFVTLIAALVAVGSISPAMADQIQLVITAGQDVARPMLEFRARGGTFASGAGHAFVLMGRLRDDGSVVFYTAGGFYPKDRPVASTPGTMTFDLEDTKTDEVFRVRITPGQQTRVGGVFQAWNAQQYPLDWQNFASLTRDVGRAIGLQMPAFTSDTVDEAFPAQLVANLRTMNDEDTPLRYEEQAEAERRARDEANRRADDREADRRALERAEDDRRTDQQKADRRTLERAQDDRRSIQRDLDRREDDRRRNRP